ncbi:hypothetical protein [Actinoplanes sp. M2I2]|uniref:hypothetical protein n=1 Tax=Actinoplanes sp. M2I2 TaxID=1734444 RepID=UPI002020A13F|nr:hypothetical protein [Actinoplanes sp. M2I2]
MRGVRRARVEDLAAVIDAAGGRAHLFGASTGGALAEVEGHIADPAVLGPVLSTFFTG